MDFGKNRIQYKKDWYWTYYSYERYDVYFYEGGRELANYVSRSARKQLLDIEKLLDYQTEERLEFVVYNKQSEFKQSNIGLSNDEQYNIGGVTRIVGTKVFLYFDGDHNKLDLQIRAGIAEILINQMMFGGNVKDMVKSSTLLSLPDWFTKGLVDYCTNPWSVETDNRVKDGIMSGRFNKFNWLTGSDAVYAGHSIWFYVSETYGESVIPNILYMAKISRNVESAFILVLGVSLKNLSHDYVDYFRMRYDDNDKTRSLPSAKNILLQKPKQSRVYGQLKVSPDGNQVVYTTNEMGQYKIWLYDVQENKAKRILKSGQKVDRINDYSYPLLAWHPSGKIFSYITEEKDQIFLTLYELETRKKSKRPIINFQKILDFSYSDDGKKFAMSAIQKGQSDIFVFTAASNGYEQITKDIYDDMNPRFVHGSHEIVFSSNRTNDTIKGESDDNWKKDVAPNYDLFIYNYVSRSTVLRRLTNTPFVNEIRPNDYDSAHYSYLTEQNGIYNRFIAHFDSVISYVDTSEHYRYTVTPKPISNYPFSILEQDVNLRAGKYAEVIFARGKYWMYLNDLSTIATGGPAEIKNTFYRDNRIKEEKRKSTKETDIQKQGENKTDVISIKPPVNNNKDSVVVGKNGAAEANNKSDSTRKDSNYIDINNYTFENEVDKKKDTQIKITVVPPFDTTKKNPVVAVVQGPKSGEFKLGGQKNYYINYATDYVVTQLDNSFLGQSYQKFAGGSSPVYLNPGFNGLFKIGLSDLFEDYRIIAGLRLSGNLNSNEYFMSFENRKHRFDKQLVLHRQAFLNVAGNYSLVKIHTHEARYMVKYPFNEVASLRGTLGIRNDRTVYLATDQQNLLRDNLFDTWGNLKLEYIYDNTIKKGLNLYNGTRLKVFGEFMRRLDRSSSALPSFVIANDNTAPQNTPTDIFVIGFDVRHYQKIHRDLIWANRLAGSTSFGNQKLIYYMGGVDNWFNPKFDNATNIATDQNYAYQTLATPVRGFYQNIRNGNSFVLWNSEIRWPIFRYLMNRPIRSDFVNNFQIIGFTDVGTAWTGPDPYSSKNSLNTTVTVKGPITIIVTTKREPIVAGYGFGVRSRILGYFVRIDWSWGIDDRVQLPRLTYLSFSLDF